MTRTKPRAVKDEERVALVNRFGYAVWLDKDALDVPLPIFHRYANAHETGCGLQTVQPYETDTRWLLFPTVHATAFAIPCTDCWPEQPRETL